MAVDNAKVVPLWPSSVSEKWRRNDCFIVSLLINCCMFCNVVLAPLYLAWEYKVGISFHVPPRSLVPGDQLWSHLANTVAATATEQY